MIQLELAQLVVTLVMTFVTAAIVAAAGYIVKKTFDRSEESKRSIEESKKSIELVKSNLRMMIKYSIVQSHRIYMERGSTSRYLISLVDEMYEQYTDLEGNSWVGQLVKEIRGLPLDDVAKAKKE